LAEIDPPTGLMLDGTNFLPALSGKKIKRNKPLIWAYFNALNEHRVAMRDGKWKVLAKLDLEKKYQNLNDQNIAEINAAKFTDFEVYKITDDIHEDYNLLKERPEEKNKLKKKLEEHYRKLLEDSHIWTVTQ